jgi:hypothetical protein
MIKKLRGISNDASLHFSGVLLLFNIIKEIKMISIKNLVFFDNGRIIWPGAGNTEAAAAAARAREEPVQAWPWWGAVFHVSISCAPLAPCCIEQSPTAIAGCYVLTRASESHPLQLRRGDPNPEFLTTPDKF